ncbi:MAG: ornithine carbamoyltransferase [Fibrobacteres bacterium]|nr:ornithine carbamoyltransferase [Fibrobacterota bacterium]
MKKKDLLSLNDYSGKEIEALLNLSAAIKSELKAKKFRRPLKDKTIALIFEKPSLRTHATFETGIVQLGGHALYLPSSNIRIGVRETAEDIAKNLERWVDGIVIRTFSQKLIETLASNASIPVINALTDDAHPCQALATALTIKEHFKSFKGVKVAYVGDGNNVAASLFTICAKLGMDSVHIGPKGYELSKQYLADVTAAAKVSGSKFTYTKELAGVKGADLIYTDVWTSMGQEAESAKRLKAFKGYQVDSKLMALAGRGAKFSHCLPAHRGEEVSAEVIDGAASIAIDEAENRLHVQKAVLATLVK